LQKAYTLVSSSLNRKLCYGFEKCVAAFRDRVVRFLVRGSALGRATHFLFLEVIFKLKHYKPKKGDREMKYCTKCGNQMADDMDFCAKCGTAVTSDNAATSVQNETQEATAPIVTQKIGQSNTEPVKTRTGMLVCSIILFVFAGLFAIGSIADASMLAGVCLFGILGLMFLVLAKVPKGSARVLAEVACFKKNNGISKGMFVGISIFLAFFLFFGIIITSEPTDSSMNTTADATISAENVNAVANTTETSATAENAPAKKEEEVPPEFAKEFPITVSPSMYENIIGFPEIKCHISNNTDKEIAAIQLYLLPKDVYGEEVHSIFVTNRLQCDTTIPANGAETFAWQMVEDSIKSGDLYVYSVYFSDGTEWGDRNASISTIKKYAKKTEAK